MKTCLTTCSFKPLVEHARELSLVPVHQESNELLEWFETQETFIAQGDEFVYDGPLSWAQHED